MVTLAEEKTVAEAKSCSGRKACVHGHGRTRAVLCLCGCWRVLVFDLELVSGFWLQNFEDDWMSSVCSEATL